MHVATPNVTEDGTTGREVPLERGGNNTRHGSDTCMGLRPPAARPRDLDRPDQRASQGLGASTRRRKTGDGLFWLRVLL